MLYFLILTYILFLIVIVIDHIFFDLIFTLLPTMFVTVSLFIFSWLSLRLELVWGCESQNL